MGNLGTTGISGETDENSETGRSWKDRLYDHYVSTGQASVHTSAGPEVAFQGRSAFINSIINRHLPKNPDSQIVDIGCGHGTWVYFLRRAGYKNAFGVDGSAEQIAAAQQMGIEGVRHQSLKEYLSETRESSIDAVLLMHIIEHLSREELFVALDGVFRILKPGGTCVVSVPNGDGIFGLGLRYGDLTHELVFTRMSAEQLFRAIGFGDIRCFEEPPVVHSLKSLVRRIIWTVGTAPLRLLYAAESTNFSPILSRTMLICCNK
jgi:SAM-dependent methyltransferase